MKGSYTVKVRNRRVTFTVYLERNITIICGDSATGKTTLISSLQYFEELGDKSGVVVESRKVCRVLRGKDWFDQIQKISDSFVFMDEGSEFITEQAFAEAIRGTDNYYVIVTRESLHQLPYSVNAVLELRRSTSRFRHTYNRTYPVYDHVEEFDRKKHQMNLILTEDSNSGHELFSFLASREGIRCLSANGKSHLLKLLHEYAGSKILVVADGAAFGANMAGVYRYVQLHQEEVILYLPESFEWLVLASDVLHDPEIGEILSAPENYVESREFFSWERYFTSLLEAKTRGTNAEYHKSHLSRYYLQEGNVAKIEERIQKGLRLANDHFYEPMSFNT